MKYLFLSLTLLLSTSVFAQKGSYVRGPNYEVIDAARGPVILWAGEPAPSDQLDASEPGLLVVLNPALEERLLVYLNASGGIKEVVDLEYERDPRVILPAKETEELPSTPVNVTFENGLSFTYRDGKASATLGKRSLPVTGEKGRYRVITDDFEAGVSIDERSGKVYHYLTHK